MKKSICEFKRNNIEVWRTSSFFTRYCVYISDKKGKSLVDSFMTRWGVRGIFKRLSMVAQMCQDANCVEVDNG